MTTAPIPAEEPAEQASWSASGPAIVWYVAASVFVLQLLTATRYGYFGDEMYHMACGEHLAWGYVDQPPLIALFSPALPLRTLTTRLRSSRSGAR